MRTTILIELCTCHYCELGLEDRGFFFFVPFLSFASEEWLSCLVRVLPNPPALWFVLSRAAIFLTWGVLILSKINWAIRSLTWTTKSSAKWWQSDWKVPLWFCPNNPNLVLLPQRWWTFSWQALNMVRSGHIYPVGVIPPILFRQFLHPKECITQLLAAQRS